MKTKKISKIKTSELMALLTKFKEKHDFNSKYYQELKAEYQRRIKNV